jgi:molecular chaperone HtpG
MQMRLCNSGFVTTTNYELKYTLSNSDFLNTVYFSDIGVTSSMNIPPRLSELLQKNDRLNGSIHHVLSVIMPWFEDNKLVFFPEYTDHGPKHIQEVLATTEALITPSAWRALGPEDAATLVLGVVLHDCAMHLSEDGFLALINNRVQSENEGFRDKPWKQLWDEFMIEARRFDERKLKALFDDTEPVQAPILDALRMTKRDRLLIGEFLRRHHPRLAHEIALAGVPGPTDKGLSLGPVPEVIKELAGVVARSHGLDLRVCVDYLRRHHEWGARRTSKVHVTYLMTLVRIADYIQIHSERAPEEVLQVRSLRSPVSRGEWLAHSAIIDIHRETNDPEALWVEAAPKDVRTYLKLRGLLADIQKELDESWAVLGEVYGAREELRSLGLTIRRVRSTLDDLGAFSKTINYIPRSASIEAAGVELLKLLIEPLYGDHPEIGIRELLQNATDACLEAQDYIKQHPELPLPAYQAQQADVVISLERRKAGAIWLEVRDKGIGMTVDTIINYFLKAGASFRNSATWRRQHEDEKGRIRVVRSGRFGVGVLAGFLLGDEIEVATRYISAPEKEGIKFTCRLDDEDIQLERAAMPVGTTIRIRISGSKYSALVEVAEKAHTDAWDWYCLKSPSVARIVDGKQLRQTYKIPSANSQQLPPQWRRIKHPDFEDVHWTYSANAPFIACNGIIIRKSRNQPFWSVDHEDKCSEEGLITPAISVFDPKGKFPLNLQRTELTTSNPLDSLIIEDVCRDFLAYVIVYAPEATFSYQRNAYLHYPGFPRRASWYWYANEGLSLMNPWHVGQLHCSSLLFVPVVRAESRVLKAVVGDSFSPTVPAFNEQYQEDVYRSLFYADTDIKIKGERILLRLSMYDEFRWGDYHYSPLPKRRNNYDYYGNDYGDSEDDDDDFYGLLDNEQKVKQLHARLRLYEIEWKNDFWILLKREHCPPHNLNLDVVLNHHFEEKPGRDLAGFAIWYFSNDPHKELGLYPLIPLRFIEAWKDIIKIPYIPYDLKVRQNLLASAYKELSVYIQAWKQLKATDNRKH